MKHLMLILITLVALVLAGCQATPGWKDISTDRGQAVTLAVSGSPAKLEIVSSTGQNCRGKGCLNSPKNSVVKASFELVDSPDWHFSRFEICLGAVKDSRVCKLDVFKRLEFAAITQAEGKIVLADDTGIINLLDLEDPDLEEFIIANQNSARQDYYYRVQVCSDSNPGECLWNEDPEWPNKGRGR